MSKSWLEKMDRPVLAISGLKHRGQNPRARKASRCIGTRKNHSWVNGRCFWCSKPRNAK